ncbi:MAG: hypothetical protein GX989_08490, partial [Firmicutes bacterium]|nr:hypothetical protein [Bacillota bacterium]
MVQPAFCRAGFLSGSKKEVILKLSFNYDQIDKGEIFLAGTIVKKSKVLTVFILAVFIFTMFFGTVSLAGTDTELLDVEGHWAQGTIQELVGEGIIDGYPDGTFRPNNKITRAEFATLIVKAFHLKAGPGKVFVDTAEHWAKDDISTANYHGLVSGYSDTLFGPNDFITREQMAVMIVNATKTDITESSKIFTDSTQIATWAKESVDKATAAGLIAGYPDGTFKPKANATRAEAAVVLDGGRKLDIEEEAMIYDKAGTYGPETGTQAVDSDVIIGVDGVILQNMVIKGDLIISEEVGDGDVNLNNVTVVGETFIRGGGKDSIHINGGQYNNIIIEKTSEGNVRLVATDVKGLKVIISEKATGEEIILEGTFESVAIKADDVTFTTRGETVIDEIKVHEDLSGITLHIEEGTKVKELVLDSVTEVKNAEGTVEKISGDKADDSHVANLPEKDILPVPVDDEPAPPPKTRVSAISITTVPKDVSNLDNDATVTVTLSTATSGANIYCTLDGSMPTSSSTKYTTSFSVEAPGNEGGSVTVKAIGMKSGYTNSAVATKTITFKAAAVPVPTGSIEIKSVEPNTSLINGTSYDFTVEVGYEFEGIEKAILYIGFNNGEEIETYHLIDEAKQEVTAKTGSYTFNVSASAKHWGEDGKFQVYVNISDYDHPEEWTPLASDRKELGTLEGDMVPVAPQLANLSSYDQETEKTIAYQEFRASSHSIGPDQGYWLLNANYENGVYKVTGEVWKPYLSEDYIQYNGQIAPRYDVLEDGTKAVAFTTHWEAPEGAVKFNSENNADTALVLGHDPAVETESDAENRWWTWKDEGGKIFYRISAYFAVSKGETWELSENSEREITRYFFDESNHLIAVHQFTLDFSEIKITPEISSAKVASIYSESLAVDHPLAWAKEYDQSNLEPIFENGHYHLDAKGSLDYVPDNVSGDTSGNWFLPFAVKKARLTLNPVNASITITGYDGEESVTTESYEYDDLEEYEESISLLVAWALTGDEDRIEIEIDWDGEGDYYTENSYTIYLEELTLVPAKPTSAEVKATFLGYLKDEVAGITVADVAIDEDENITVIFDEDADVDAVHNAASELVDAIKGELDEAKLTLTLGDKDSKTFNL